MASSPSSSVQLSSSVSSQSRLSSASVFSFSCQFSPLELWHCRLEHMPFDNMKHIDVVPSCNPTPTFICHVCHKARQHRSSFPTSTSCTSHIFEMIHVDLWGPYANSTYDGYKYFITVVDDYSRATWTHLSSHKSNAFSILKSFISFIQTQFQINIKIIRSDNGLEFSDQTSTTFYASHGIIHQTCCTGTPQ